ncbi:hypothetical protein GCM10023189_32180 [Nibrella saemangeumensis]|uniref:Uncharacterized protein n=2 Tax=Nibrella saemangeumensis TaxID=1084526 RepID=A0ABP8N1X2_9BACT
MFSNKFYSNELIFQRLMSKEPCMIGRIGATEMLCLVNYLGVMQNNKKWIDFVKTNSLPWWWEDSTLKQMEKWSGFFPAQKNKIEEFCKLMLDDLQEVDILGSWLNQEVYLEDRLINAKKVVLEDLEPFFAPNPWTKALEGKNVLVVHPFSETIKLQYEKREFLFSNQLLPEFNLSTVKAVQSIAGESTEFEDWFDALKWMKFQIDNINYDICIIGCGAYGFPLAAHVKRMGKKAVHLAGATQLLFGIKGKRWEKFIVWPYVNLFNEHWVRPGENEKPQNANIVEGACYW